MSYVIYNEFRAPISPRDVPSEILDKWSETLKMRRDLIYSRLMLKVPTEEDFLSKIATSSSVQWENFVNPAFPDGYLITLKQRIKLAVSYPRWNTGIVDAFKIGGRFEQGIDLKKDRFAQVRYTLGNVGIRYLGWGPGYKAVGFVTGDHRVLFIPVPEESITGEPMSAFPPEYVEFVRPALIAMLTQGAVLALYADEQGLESLRDMVVGAVNMKISSYMAPLLIPDYSQTILELSYNPDTGKIEVHASVRG